MYVLWGIPTRHNGEKLKFFIAKYTWDQLNWVNWLKSWSSSSSSSTKGSLINHKRTQSGEKPNKCNFCDFACTLKNNLKRHVRDIHSGEKPNKCNQCSYSCTEALTLRDHMRKHTGEKPFMCKSCGSSFTFLKSLSFHLANKHAHWSWQKARWINIKAITIYVTAVFQIYPCLPVNMFRQW